MSSTAPYLRRPTKRAPRFGLRRVGAWMLTLFVLLFATPGVVTLVQEVLSQATGVECCADGCCDDGFGCCPRTCAHCKCCAQPIALPAAAPLLPLDGTRDEGAFAWRSDRPYASGFRISPFRPPVS